MQMSSDEDRPLPSFNRKAFTDLFSVFDQWFEEPFSFFDRQIKVDMYETNDNLVIEADVAGVKKEQIQLEWLAEGLKISVENKSHVEETNQAEKYYRKERTFSQRERFIPLGLVSSPKNIKAKYENGVVMVTIPHYNLRQKNRNIIDID